MTNQSLHKAMSYREALNKAMHDAMAVNDQVVLFGQGINDHKNNRLHELLPWNWKPQAA